MKSDPDHFFEGILSSYEDRVKKIQAAFQSSENITESSHSLFNNIHNSLIELKQEREKLNARLCVTLAKNSSLRKKDYNLLMAGILNALDEKEKEAETRFASFFEAQKETVQSLKNGMLDIKDLPAENAGGKITILKEQVSQISKQLELRKESVIKTFKDFQLMHDRMMERLENLLEKGDHIMIQDIKCAKDQINMEINPVGHAANRI